jgi:hypothetical protein
MYYLSDFLAFVEPHLTATDDVDISGFHSVHRTNCRRGRNSEGVIILARNSLHVDSDHLSSCQAQQSEPIIIKDFSLTGHCLIVRLLICNVNVVVVYKSPQYSSPGFLDKLKDVLKIIGKNVVVFGDFNIDLQKPEGKNVLQLFSLFGLEAKLNSQHSSTDGGTHIDFCFSDVRCMEAWFYETYYSYHKAICMIWPKINV